MIGILFARPMLYRLMRGKRSFERPAFYMGAAQDAGEEVVFFALKDIDWKTGTVRAWNGRSGLLSRKQIPPVIVNRTRTLRRGAKQSIRRLKEMGKIVFNERNVVSKLSVHQILAKERKLLPHLPETEAVSRHAVEQLLERNGCLFLKPNTASVGNGIIRLRRKKEATVAEINVLGKTKKRKMRIRQIVNIVKGRKRKYLVQQGISLMKYKENPVDFRVSLQKNGKGRWQLTGMVGKIAKRKSIVTNLHCGGKSQKASVLFEHWGWDCNEMYKKTEKLGVRIAKALERELPHIADLGLDIAFDEDRHPWFIEANFRDLRITFRNAGEREMWRSTFANPVAYAAYLARSAASAASVAGEPAAELPMRPHAAGNNVRGAGGTESNG